MRKSWLLPVLAVAILANAVLIGLVLTGGNFAIASGGGAAKPAKGGDRGTTVHISTDPLPTRRPSGGDEAGKKESEEVYRELIAELTEQKRLLDKKAEELVERERQVGVIRAEIQAHKQLAASAVAAQASPAETGKAAATDSFKKLVKAFAGMEPENAAKALVELYGRDRDGAVELMLALPARKAAAVLDAVASRKASIAADLSFEMSHNDDPRAQ